MMWNSVYLPREANDPGGREKRIERFAAEKMREYDGTVFLCVSPADRERKNTFCQAAASLGYTVLDGRTVCIQIPARELAKEPGRQFLFVHHSMSEYLGDYLDACPDEARHLLFYSRRRGNGPSPHMSGFMDFWVERGVDILDLGDVDREVE